MRGPRYATVGIDEEIGVEDSGSSSCLTAVSAPLRLLRRVCPWATPFDLVILVILLVTAAVIVTFSAVHDLHATMLHLLGMDHTKLTFSYQGRQMRLTDVYGDPVKQLIS
jgi:hypothetical protein